MKNFKLLILIFHFSLLIFNFGARSADAALLINRPLYLGLTSGLVGYWSFDGPDMAGNTAYDRSGNANDGTLINNPTRAVGRIGQALKFDGADDRVDISSPSFNGAEPFTISVWIKPASLGEGSLGRIMSFNNATTDDLRMGVGPLVNFSPNGGAGGDCDSNNITLNVWVHVVFTLSSTGVCTFYIDGVNQTFDSSGQTIGASTSFSIGNLVGGVTRTFDGPIDEFRFYNRILSPDEIKRLYKIGATMKVNKPNYVGLDSGLVGYWSFDGPDMAGDTAYDRSGSSPANNGTLTNGPVRALGKIGQALEFDGSDDYVDIANESNFDFERTQPFSYSLWTKPKAGDTSISLALGKILDSGNFTGWALLTNYDYSSNTEVAGRLAVALVNISGTTNAIGIEADSKINDGGWHHYTVTYDGSSFASGIKIYEDGISLALTVASDSLTGSILNNVNIEIGDRDSGASSLNYPGLIDDVRVYNRVLTSDEIKRLYNLGR